MDISNAEGKLQRDDLIDQDAGQPLGLGLPAEPRKEADILQNSDLTMTDQWKDSYLMPSNDEQTIQTDCANVETAPLSIDLRLLQPTQQQVKIYDKHLGMDLTEDANL